MRQAFRLKSAQWYFLLLWFIHPSAQAAKAFLDHDTIYTGESVQLTLLVEGEWLVSDLDLQPLNRHFHILGRTAGTQLRFEQGKIRARTRWAIHLQPKQTGELEIPRLTIGEEQTPALSLTVTEQSVDTLLEDTEMRFESHITPQQPYVQAQVLYTARVWHTGNVLEHDFIAPSVSAGLYLQALGDERNFQAQREGKEFHVIEQSYALFAEKSGDLAVPPITFRARMIYGQDDRKSRLTSRRITLSTKPVTLEIRPQPVDYPGQWLPSKNLQLRFEWPDKTLFQTGEPITATLILEGIGVRGFQLPAPHWPTLAHLQLYPETPSISTEVTPEGLVGRWKQTLSLVPTAAGQIELPQLMQTWWDTESDTPRQAKTQSRRIQISAVDLSSRADAGSKESFMLAEKNVLPYYWPLASLILLILWLTTLSAWRCERRRNPIPPPVISDTTNRTLIPYLQRACLENDPATTANTLLNWARQHWSEPSPANLNALARYWPQHRQELLELDRTLYGRSRPVWDGHKFWHRLQADLEQSVSS